MSRWVGIAVLVSAPLAAQDPASTEPAERIDLLAQARENAESLAEGDRVLEQCAPEDVDVIAGTITVCRRLRDDTGEVWDQEAWQKDYARRTMGAGPVNTFGIPDHGVVVARGCFIPPCPPPLAILIDVEALPEAPAESDADRVARGLPPRSRD